MAAEWAYGSGCLSRTAFELLYSPLYCLFVIENIVYRRCIVNEYSLCIVVVVVLLELCRGCVVMCESSEADMTSIQ